MERFVNTMNIIYLLRFPGHCDIEQQQKKILNVDGSQNA